jgi:hypothetical protein
MKTYDELRSTYPTFEYHAYTIREGLDSVYVEFRFEIAGLSRFAPSWNFPKAERGFAGLEENQTLARLVFNLGMAELASYWKATCSPRIVVYSEFMEESQRTWWQKLYYQGLGEFFYQNGIEADATSFAAIESKAGQSLYRAQPLAENDLCLIPVGGGKDSAVTLELLKSRQEKNYCYIINPREASLRTAEIAGYPGERVLAAKRTLDDRLIKLNEAGYLNGHTPFSAVVAFSALVSAYINGITAVALSNESSANEPTIAGSHVNHQYSKSFEFERDFIAYEKDYIGSGIAYFSLLRPFSEYQIARHFARQPHYFADFKSCNKGSKEDKWCGHCPKCLFVCLILSPFLTREQLTAIFAGDLLADESLAGTLEELTGIAPEKPFECVGSRGEANYAIRQAIAQIEAAGEELPVLFKHYIDRTSQSNPAASVTEENYDKYYDKDNAVPEGYLPYLAPMME